MEVEIGKSTTATKKIEQDMDALVLICMEILDNVPDVSSTFKIISEQLGNFFDLDELAFVEHDKEQKALLYCWSRSGDSFVAGLQDNAEYEWKKLVHIASPDGSIVLKADGLERFGLAGGSSVCIALSTSVRDFKGSVLFGDRKSGRDWEMIRPTLVRIANQIFYRLRMLKKEEANRIALDRKFNYDGVTGLLVYNKLIEQVGLNIEANGTKGLACVYTDFSGFKYFNETYGFEQGDLVLGRFARLLKEHYGESGLFCRITSDHFAGFIRGEDTNAILDDYKAFTEEFSEDCNKEYSRTNIVLASGFYTISNSDTSIAAMMDNANEARKKCKEQMAETQVRVYTEDLRQELENVRMINANILKALKNREFHAYLQPKVSLKSGKIEGAEALVRWIRPDGTRVMPDDFIGIAEQNGYITKIDFAVLEQVLEYLEDAVAKDEEVVPVSVNFSRKNNEIDDFVSRVMERISSHHVNPKLIEAEITESVFMADLSEVDSNMRKLRDAGVEVSVDDFGSGYSSLNILAKVAADTIKLDRLFLNNAKKDEKGLTVIRCLTQMLKKLGFMVIAEGVETEEQLTWIRLAECDMVQGFYYAKPMTIEEFRVFLKEFNSREVDFAEESFDNCKVEE